MKRPDQCETMEVMWADASVYGPPAPGSKVGDFIQTWLMGSWNCGVFTHREIAKTTHGYLHRPEGQGTGVVREPKGKDAEKWEAPRAPGQVAAGAGGGGWCISTDCYIDAREPASAQTISHRHKDGRLGLSTWFMCTPEAAGKLIAMDYDNLAVKETTIVG